MNNSEHYGLILPEGTDFYDVEEFNANAETIDYQLYNNAVAIRNHDNSRNNPHEVTKSQVGLGSVPNVSTNNQTPTYTEASELTELTSGEKLTTAFSKLSKAVSSLIAHIGDNNNPHNVTKSQVGLGSVGNFKAVSTKASQGLSATEQTNARTNINAASTAVASSSADGLMSKSDKSKFDEMGMATYGTCSTAAATAAKVVTLSNSNWQLKVGSIIGVKYSITNTASSVTLNVNSTGAKSIYYNNGVYTGSSNAICGYANRTCYYMYDGTYWVFIHNGIIDSNTRYDADAVCGTNSGTAAKTASATGFVLRQYCRFTLRFTVANTAESALTLNVNSTGAKPLYINNVISSSSNCTLPAGDYAAYYDGTNYYVRTDYIIPGLDNVGSGTVTSVATGAGLKGGPITGSGTIQANLKSTTKSTLTAIAKGTTANREYAVGLDKNGNLSVNIPWDGSGGGGSGNAYFYYQTSEPAATVVNSVWVG